MYVCMQNKDKGMKTTREMLLFICKYRMDLVVNKLTADGVETGTRHITYIHS